MRKDWYEHRDELRPGMVFRTADGDIVRLDRSVPGDATRWYVADWWGGSWAYLDSTIEPGDLMDAIEDFDAELLSELRTSPLD